MKRFIGFVIKEFYHIIRDKRTLLILIGMPIAQILIFGYVVTNEIRDAKIAILDNSKDEVTLAITNKLLGSGYFILDSYLESENEIEDKFQEGNIREVVIFDKDFSASLEREKSAAVQIIADASDVNTASLISSYTNAIIADYSAEYFKDYKMPYEIKTNVTMLYNKELKGAYMFVPGTMALILMLISALMTSVSIAREKEMGTMEVLLVSPLKPLPIILGKVVPYVGMAFLNAITIILMGYFVFDVPVEGSAILLMLESILFITQSLVLGIFISTMSNRQQTAMFISLFGLLMPTMLLSGFIFPVQNMPYLLQLLSNVIPAKWFIIIIKDIMLKGNGIMFVWQETLILLGMTLFFIALSIRKFKIRLD